jgi:hypothetical protein
MHYSPLRNLGRSCFFFFFSAILGRATAAGSVLVHLSCEYAQSIRNFDVQFSASSDFLPESPIKFMAQVRIFWDISGQDSSSMSISA